MKPESFRNIVDKICVDCNYYTEDPYSHACTLHGFNFSYGESYTCVCDDFCEVDDGEGGSI